MLWTHRNCLEGDGVTTESCGRRAFLLELCRANGWSFPGVNPTAEPGPQRARVRQRHNSSRRRD
ncbi:hypothetical protein JK358_21845 [Nocardia sp. 2]|uniref:Uncharacterized protein n=1 Tax=Nocardia acididurans TaxID=2802282 RepID=A0ABS1M8S2_9NOCA|nr:hypothetical protein [Nocardia acididurans]MBL1077045.1 hypothetical protein [Nocardia acididurans]